MVATATLAALPNDTAFRVVSGTSTGTITDANGNIWAVAGGKVTVNGVVDSTTANVIELAYVNGNVWQENASDLWWVKTVPTDQWAPGSGTPKSPLPYSTSPNDTVITVAAGTSSGAITDAKGNIWAVAGGKVTVNGVVDPTTANVIELAYVNGKVWQENTSDLWWADTGADRSMVAFDRYTKKPPAHSPSPNDTVITVVAGTISGMITDAKGNNSGVAGGKVTENGTADPTSANVIKLAYVNGKVWQERHLRPLVGQNGADRSVVTGERHAHKSFAERVVRGSGSRRIERSHLPERSSCHWQRHLETHRCREFHSGLHRRQGRQHNPARRDGKSGDHRQWSGDEA